MIETKRSAEVLIKELELLHSSPEKVYDWYKTISDSDEELDTEDLDSELESKLLDRKEKLIDLAIAKFGQHPSSVSRVFNKARIENDEVMTLACLSNTALGRSKYSFSSIPSALVEGYQEGLEWFPTLNERQIRQLFENPTIEDGFIVTFLSGKEHWGLINEKMRLSAILGLCHNPRMKTTYDSKFKWMDGYTEFSYGLVFTEAWNLSETVPVTKTWALYLGELYAKMPGNPSQSVLSRWMVDDEDDKEDEKGKKSFLNPFETVRARIYGKTIKNKYTKDDGNKEYFESEDTALRWSAYRTLWITPEEIKQAYKRDGLLAIDAMLDAYYIWRDKERRQALHDICWDASETYENYHLYSANHFNYQQEEFEKKYPEWFKEEDVVEEVDENDRPLTVGLARGVVSEELYQQSVELLTETIRIEKETRKILNLLLFFTGFTLALLIFKLL